jgi:hypothetical protein
MAREHPVTREFTLAATLYHECIHMRLFMDKFTTGSADPTLSPYQASYRGYLRLAHAAPEWNALIAAWAAHLAGGAPVTDVEPQRATIPAFPPATSTTSPTPPTSPTDALNPPPEKPSP